MISKLDMKSKQIKEENIFKIMQIFPSCISETKDENGNVKKAIDFELLKQELSENIIEGPKERYSLNWPGKKEALLTANSPTTKTLRPSKEDSVNFDTTENLYIEGDNLEVLKVLQESYLNRIKMIYIDPPYNTGNDFIYKDDFAKSSQEELVDSGQIDEEGAKLTKNLESNGRYHSDWLSMMYTRLKLARNLLQDDGVIFISIDENEVFNLRHLCNSIFGEDNFLTELVIKVRHENRILKADKDFHETYEYCLIYRKSAKYKQTKKIEDNRSIDKYVYSIKIKNEHIDEIMCDEKKVLVYSPNDYEVVKHEEANEDYYQSISIRGSLKEGNSSGRFFMKHLDKIKDKYGYLYKVPDIGNDKYSYRYFMRPPTENHANGIYYQGIPLDKKDTKEVPYPNFYDMVKEFNNVGNEGGVEYRNGKKPVEFLEKLFKLGGLEEDKEAFILDFFAGSSSTAHSVMKLNSVDDGKRKFIMVQLPEDLDKTYNEVSGTTKSTVEKTINFLDDINKPHILSELGKERIRRSGKQIVEESGKVDLDIGFRVLKLDSSNMKDIYFNPSEISQDNLFDTVDNIKDERSDLDLLFGVLIDWGVDLTLPITKENIAGKDCYFVDEDSLCACFAKEINEEFIKELAARDMLRVVFRDSGFASDDVKDNVSQIFKQLNPTVEIKVI